MASRRSARLNGTNSKRTSEEVAKSDRDARYHARRKRKDEESLRISQNESIDDADHHDGLVCACCGQLIANSDDHFTVSPCRHGICTLCMIRSHITRGPMDHTCPAVSCGCPTNGCIFVSKREEKEELKNPTNIPADYVKNNLPVELLCNKHRQDLINDREGSAVVLFAAVASVTERGEMGIKSIASSFFIGKDNTIPDRNTSLEKIGEFGAFLHPLIIPPSLPKTLLRPVLSPRELMELRCHKMRLIDMFLYSLATGNSHIDVDQILSAGQQDHQSKFLATAVVSSDVILRGSFSKPLEFQLMLKEVFNRQNLTGEFLMLASALNIAPSKNFQLRTRHDETLSKMKEGVKPNARDLVIILFDNIGYKVLGRQASYDQWIILNIVVIKEDDLKKVGFYVHDDDPTKQISREASVNWEEKIKTLTTEESKLDEAESIVGLTQDDYNKLAECTLSDIQVAIDYSSNCSVGTILPRLDLIINSETRKAMEARKENKGKSVTKIATEPQYVDLMPRDGAHVDVSNEIGGNVLGNNVNDDLEGDIDDEDEEDEGDITSQSEGEAGAKNKGRQNRYQRNNDTKLQVSNDDLNKKHTVMKLMKYGADSREQQMRKWAIDKTKYSPTAEEPVANIIIPLGTDGQPANQASKILREDKGSLFPEQTWVSFGGMHTVMKTLNANGELFEPLMRGVISAVRDSVDKQNFYLHPYDPRQREQEYPLVVLAHYLVALEGAMEVHGDRPVSAEEVHQYMLDRAEEYATCAFALLELRMGAIAKMMRYSGRLGKKAGVQLFFTTLKFALRLFTVTHKTDYVCLCCDLLQMYHCASPAQRTTYDEYIFTRVTANGTFIFHDESVEKSVMDMRQYTGKVYRPGLAAELEYLSATIPERSGVSNSTRTMRDKDATTRASDRFGIKVNEHLGKLVERIKELQLWKYGEPPIVPGEKAGERIECKPDIITLPGGVNLPSETLSSITGLGDKRVKDYFVEWYIDKYGVAERNEKGLTRLKTTKKDLVDATKLQIKLATSCDKKDLSARECTKAMLRTEIQLMQDRDEARTDKKKKVKVPSLKIEQNTKKEVIVDFLIKWRNKEFRKYPQLMSQLIERINKKRNDSNVMEKTKRKELLKSEFFSLQKYIERKDG